MSAQILKQIWPEWQIEEKPIGKGSFGVVYKAVRRGHNVESYAAIKVVSIPADLSEIDSLRSEGLDLNATKTYFLNILRDFIGEIQVMESLKGVQNIVSVEDYKVVEKNSEIGWDIHIRMELLTPFNAYIRDRALSEKEVIKLGLDICTALEICEKRNIIHRDIKPENIFINDFGHFKLGDFGIARKLENRTGGLSQKGTFNYMAPEVASGTNYDSRVDIYSLGIVLYRLLNKNRLPFLDSDQQLLNPNERRAALDRRLRGEALPAPCQASPAMTDLILRACAFNPDMRFASATEMKQALMSVENGTYQTEVCDLDKTTSVRKAPPAENDKKNSGGKDSDDSNRKSGPTVKTFGTVRKRRRKIDPRIVNVLIGFAVALFTSTALFGGYKLVGYVGSKVISSVSDLIQKNDFDGLSEIFEKSDSEAADSSGYETTGDAGSEAPNHSGSETVEDNDSETANDPTSDEDPIVSIINEAEVLAAKEDYEGALTKIQAGLMAYPESPELQNKANEYSESLATQIKAKTLAKAKSLADSGDYVAAMALIKNAQDDFENDPEYRDAYNTYNKAYLAAIKGSAIESADKLAVNGDYLGAIAIVNKAMEIAGDDSELSARIAQYTQAHISATIKTAYSLADNKSFKQAFSVLNEALKYYPGNRELQQAVAAVEETKKLSSLTRQNPNQNPVAPKAPEEHTISGGSDKANAVAIQREDVYHSSLENETVKWFKFTTSSNYSAYSIEIVNISVNWPIHVTIYDIYDREIANGSAGEGSTGYIGASLEENTEYWLKIRASYGEDTGNYQISVNEKICDAGMEQTDAFYLDIDEQYTKAFDVNGLCDWFKFKTTNSYSTYQLVLENSSVHNLLFLMVYDEYGAELGKIDAGKGGSSTLHLKLSADREYTVKIYRSYTNQNGYYQIKVSEMVCDAGLSQSEAFPKKINEVIYGALDTRYDDWYVYIFTETGTYTLKLTNNSADTTVYATVYDILGTELGKIDAYKTGTNERSLEIPAGTTLYVKISRTHWDRYGNYTLQVY